MYTSYQLLLLFPGDGNCHPCDIDETKNPWSKGQGQDPCGKGQGQVMQGLGGLGTPTKWTVLNKINVQTGVLVSTPSHVHTYYPL